jgi:hypothetical protein
MNDHWIDLTNDHINFSFIGGGNPSTQGKPLTYHKSLTLSHNVVSPTESKFQQ